jgi:hypothetical protein
MLATIADATLASSRFQMRVVLSRGNARQTYQAVRQTKP